MGQSKNVVHTVGPYTEHVAKRHAKAFTERGARVTIIQELLGWYLKVDTSKATFRLGK